MSDELSTSFALQCLRGAGFQVDTIPSEPAVKRADLRAHYDTEEYLIEAKAKAEGAEWNSYVGELNSTAVAPLTREIASRSTITRVIKEVYEQLVATPAGNDAFRLAWLVALHDDGEYTMECAKVRLFGLETVSVIDEHVAIKPCFYYGYSSFREYEQMDGAVLSVREGLKLCVNSFSPRRAAFMRSRLYTELSRVGPVCDPVALEAAGNAFLVGKDFVGKPGGRDVWQYLLIKYGVRTSVMTRSQFNSGFAIPR